MLESAGRGTFLRFRRVQRISTNLHTKSQSTSQWIVRPMSTVTPRGRHDERRPILTLDPNKFEATGQQPVSLAHGNPARLRIHIGGKYVPPKAVLQAYCEEHNNPRKYLPFPETAMGYIYYDLPPPNRPAISGSIRFRVLDNPDAPFETGRDLHHPPPHQYNPWRLPLVSLVRSKASYAHLAQKLVEDGLVSPELVSTIRAIPALPRPLQHSTVLYTLHDPFVSHIHQISRFTSITTQKVVTTYLDLFSRDMSSNKGIWRPYQGTILARLEPSPAHPGKRVLALRVLDILSPITVLQPEHTEFTTPPEKGKFLMHRKAKDKPWELHTFDLDTEWTMRYPRHDGQVYPYPMLKNLLSEGYGLE